MATQKDLEFLVGEMDRLYGIVAVFEPVVRYYLSSYESTNKGTPEPEAVKLVRRALAAMEQGITIEEIAQEETEQDGNA